MDAFIEALVSVREGSLQPEEFYKELSHILSSVSLILPAGKPAPETNSKSSSANLQTQRFQGASITRKLA